MIRRIDYTLGEKDKRELKKALARCCVRVFEVSCKPDQAERYTTDADQEKTA